MNLEELYQEIILDHSKRPRNFGPLEGANVRLGVADVHRKQHPADCGNCSRAADGPARPG